AEEIVNSAIDERAHPEEWDLKPVFDGAMKQFGVALEEAEAQGAGKREDLAEAIVGKAWKVYDEKVAMVGDAPFADFEKVIMLHTLDTLWKDHLLSMDHLKGGIGLRGYGQKNPLQEYKKEGFDLFVDMIYRLKSEVCERLFKVQIRREEAPPPQEEPAREVRESKPEPGAAQAQQRHREQKVTYSRGEEEPEEEAKEEPVVRMGEKIGRNDQCPCGSGKKYKKCCGAEA
ncbi:MAG TPA: SEC-C metal-binding domain-containing protein, partial [Thermodesulfobacteriota bacterium]|nr:SEC-C metal-binding domain-containing protein [Thermodesulfobacteriota bacterium]